MQRVVSDADVIIQLAKLNELNLIKELYECAHINFFSKEKTLTKREGMNQGCLTKGGAIKLLNKLKAREFRIHPNIIESAIDSLEG